MMKNRKLFMVLLAGVMIFSCITSLTAQDWTQWRGANRDGIVKGFTPPENWPPELTMQWRKTIGPGDATPLLAGDNLYLFTRQDDNEVILCLDAASGNEIWRNDYAASAVTGAASRHPGPRSTPAISDGKIVTLGATGILSCLDAATGKLLWRKDPFPGIVPMFFTAMSPVIVDGLCIAQLGGAGNGAMIAYDMNSGEERWRWSGEGPDYGSPVLLKTDGVTQIVSPTEKSIVGVDLADGKLLWQLPFAPVRRAYNAATPIVSGNRVFYSGAGRGTHAVRIAKQGEQYVPTALWDNEELSVQFNTPVLKQNMLYGYSSSGTFFCIDATTGQTAWSDTVNHERSGFAAILDLGPVIMALPGSSELIFIKPVRDQYTELANIKIADLATYATPVVAGDRIFIRDEQNITMWKIK